MKRSIDTTKQRNEFISGSESAEPANRQESLAKRIKTSALETGDNSKSNLLAYLYVQYQESVLADKKNAPDQVENNAGSQHDIRPVLPSRRRAYSESCQEIRSGKIADQSNNAARPPKLALAAASRAISVSDKAVNKAVQTDALSCCAKNVLHLGWLLKPLIFGTGKANCSQTYEDEVVAHCSEYTDDIFEYSLLLEQQTAVREHFLSGSNFTSKSRMILLDWVTTVQLHFNYAYETQYATLALLDRYLMSQHPVIDKERIQLMATACITIAAKYEEPYPLQMEDFVNELEYDMRELAQAEYELMRAVECDLRRPYVTIFVRRLSEYYIESVDLLARKIADVACYFYPTCHVKPSVTAAVAVYLAAFLEHFEFPEKLHEMSKVPKQQILGLVPRFAAAVLFFRSRRKVYQSLYRRMYDSDSLVFTNEHLSVLSLFAGMQTH